MRRWILGIALFATLQIHGAPSDCQEFADRHAAIPSHGVSRVIILRRCRENFSAYSPDLLGCVATGATREEAEKNMYEAIQLHIEGLCEGGLPIPDSTAIADYVVVGA